MNNEKKYKSTHIQTDRYILIDNILSSGDIYPFSYILNTLRETLRDNKYSPSTLRRDIEYMQNRLGAPIKYDKTKNGWHYTQVYNLPLKSISSTELEKLAILKKLLTQFNYEDSIYKGVEELITKLYPSTNNMEFMDRIEIPKKPKPIFDKSILDIILEALHENYLLDFTYKSRWDPDKTHRKVMPFQLVIDDGLLFLYAGDIKNSKDIRLYKISKIQNLSIIKKTFTLPENYRFKEDFEKGRWGAFQYDETYEYKIEFYNDARNFLKEKLWADDQVLIDDNVNNITTMTFSSSQWIPIRHWLLSFGGNAKPIEPDWFVKEWENEVIKMHKKITKK